jgi:hypothetical protein
MTMTSGPAPEPIIVAQTMVDGVARETLATAEWPARTIVAGAFMSSSPAFITPTAADDGFTIELGTRRAIYNRIATTIDGAWVCELVEAD